MSEDIKKENQSEEQVSTKEEPKLDTSPSEDAIVEETSSEQTTENELDSIKLSAH